MMCSVNPPGRGRLPFALQPAPRVARTIIDATTAAVQALEQVLNDEDMRLR